MSTVNMSSSGNRTCVGCRQRSAPRRLLRFRLADASGVAVDPESRHGGRGADVCPRRSCLSAAAQRGGFSRAFRCRVDPDGQRLVDQTVAAVRDYGDLLVRQCVADGRARPVHGPGGADVGASTPSVVGHDALRFLDRGAAERIDRLQRFLDELLEQ